ncbi:DUF502 domain-containing protein [Pinibacter aurantiacus]|uniref:DUF502 domain-containing protein n=1 Tax=Pinibacter aurantiacus TaxID=2851599 RepID=A0A9E2W4H3_9BACT|nr:hypothetical protein [Pinibacter aurantiacus]MBV4357483.1 hypothetical protein [Pinibacter aurantiacus]
MESTPLRSKRSFKIIRNHIITGFVFLMPVLISIAVLEKFWSSLLKIGNKVSKLLFIDTLLGATGDAIIAIILLLAFCILAGFLVKLSVFKRMSDWLDEKLALFIPGYNDLRKETEVKVGVGPKKEEVIFETCLVHTQEYWTPAYLVDVASNGDATVFIPAAPSFSSGQVAIVKAGSYKKLQINSKTLNEYLVKLGKGIAIA